jgi:hypothetical protein
VIHVATENGVFHVIKSVERSLNREDNESAKDNFLSHYCTHKIYLSSKKREGEFFSNSKTISRFCWYHELLLVTTEWSDFVNLGGRDSCLWKLYNQHLTRNCLSLQSIKLSCTEILCGMPCTIWQSSYIFVDWFHGQTKPAKIKILAQAVPL